MKTKDEAMQIILVGTDTEASRDTREIQACIYLCNKPMLYIVMDNVDNANSSLVYTLF